MDSVAEYVTDDVDVVAIRQLSKALHCFVGGDVLRRVLDINVTELTRFSKCWNHLKLDEYMADGGTYRYRRYGQFSKPSALDHIFLLPHEPYSQSANVNSLNGGIKRHFEPLTSEFLDCSLLSRLLIFMSELYDSVEGQSTSWNIRLHPYRIYADSTQAGLPTPEGLHRDGVTYIASLLISRFNIMGGRTKITDVDRNSLSEVMLEKPFDLVMADDLRTMHQVSAIKPEILGTAAYRDVLVIAFTKIVK